MRSGKLPEALKELAAIRQDDPSFLLAGILQAFGYASKQDGVTPLKIVEELIEQQPDLPVLYNVRGYLHDIFEHSEKAMRISKLRWLKTLSFTRQTLTSRG